MKRIVLGLVAAAMLTFAATGSAEAGCHHGYGGGYGWGGGYRGGYYGGGRVYGPPVYRPPVTVYRPIYPQYGGTSFYYNGPGASFGFGF